MASGFTSSGLNYPLLAIPAYYVFSVVPHVYAMTILGNAGYKPNYANPRASLSPDAIKGKVPDAVFQKFQRAEAAQNNNYEQMPLFFAAVLSSLLAERVAGPSVKIGGTGELDPTGLTMFIGGWFAVRTAYNVAYVTIEDSKKSVARSLLWVTGTVLATYQIFKAAQVLG